MNKKKLAIVALALALCIGIASAGYFIISNIINKEASVIRTNGIYLTFNEKYGYRFPDVIELGKNYTFWIDIQNVLSQELINLTTYFIFWMPKDDGSNETLKSHWLLVYYSDAIFQQTLDFEEQNDGSLLATLGPWNAPVGFKTTAIITLRLDAQRAPEGKLCMCIYVLSPTFP